MDEQHRKSEALTNEKASAECDLKRVVEKLKCKLCTTFVSILTISVLKNVPE